MARARKEGKSKKNRSNLIKKLRRIESNERILKSLSEN
jgi:hypothetical protein